METQYTELAQHILAWLRLPSANGDLNLIKQRINMSLSEEIEQLDAKLSQPGATLDKEAFATWERQYLDIVTKTVQDENLGLKLTSPSTGQFFSLVKARLTEKDVDELAVVKAINKLTLLSQLQPVFDKAEAVALQSIAQLQKIAEAAMPKLQSMWKDIKAKIDSRKTPKP